MSKNKINKNGTNTRLDLRTSKQMLQRLTMVLCQKQVVKIST